MVRRRFAIAALVLLAGVLLASATSEGDDRQPRLAFSSADPGDPNNAIIAVRDGPRQIALTFDDGPLPEATGRILTFLRRHRVRATFFIVGRRLERDPQFIRPQLAAGHELHSHTWSHELLPPRSAAAISSDIRRGERSLQRASGRRSRYFRPPHGYFDRRVSSAAAAAGLRTVGWDVSIDRLALGRSPRQAARMLLDRVKPGSIVLGHDAPNGEARARAVLSIVVPELRRRGYRFVTLSELLSSVPGHGPKPPPIASSSPPSVPTSSVPSAASAG